MSADNAQKRKACQSCTRAKAKCSPFENRRDLCYRCQRLGKDCVYDETARKRGPKHRSRVRQLEQRVESLIGLLESNGQVTRDVPILSNTSGSTESPSSAGPSSDSLHPRVNSTDTTDTPDSDSNEEEDEHDVFDPVVAGLIDDARATDLLRRFRDTFVLSFPFVVVPSSIDAETLRHDQPFLFHAIMAVMTYETPSTQNTLVDEFRKQMASRIVRQSHRSLEILQGLLINAAWYHLYYKSRHQALATVVHLCVAMVQDLDLSRKPKIKTRSHVHRSATEPCPKVDRTAAEKRAFLGTYVMAVGLSQGFAQAWRKSCTMVYTKFMVQCCQSLSDNQDEQTDALIAPIVQLSNLVSRVSDHFSYDDMDNAEFRGEMMLEIYTNGFSRELDHIRNAVPASMRQNAYLSLRFVLLDIWIHECAIHSPLWNLQPSQDGRISPYPPIRARMLYRALKATTAYLATFLNIPDESLYDLAFPAWTGWFYVIVVTCKLVFLNEMEHHGPTDFESIPRDLTGMLPSEFTSGVHDVSRSPLSSHQPTAIWNPIAVAKEARIPHHFERFAEKLFRLCSPNGDIRPSDKEAKNPFWNFHYLQVSLMNGFNKRMKEYTSKLSVADKAKQSSTSLVSQPSADSTTSAGTFNVNTLPDPHHPTCSQTNTCSSLGNFLDSWNFHDVNYEGVDVSGGTSILVPLQSPVPTSTQQHYPEPQQQSQNPNQNPNSNPAYDDWVWDMMMEDIDFDIPMM